MTNGVTGIAVSFDSNRRVTLEQVEAEVAIARDPLAAASSLLLDLDRLGRR